MVEVFDEENKEESGWIGTIQKTAAGIEKLAIFMGTTAEAVPFGSAVSIVVSHIQEARELQRLAQEKQEKMVASIKRTEKTLLQMEENQLSDQSKHKPVLNLLSEYASLLGKVDVLCKAWNRLNCMQQLCFSANYNDEFEELTEMLAALKSDLALSTMAKIDAEARINAMKTQSAIAEADESAQGRHVETTAQLMQAAKVQEETREYVQEIKDLVENAVTTNAMTCKMTTKWDSILEFDWTATGVGVVSDACRAIAVGLVDQENSSQMLLMQFFDTEEEYDYRAAQRGGGIVASQRPVWAMTMLAKDMKKVRSTFVQQGLEVAQPILIHEEPLLDDQEWYAKAWWVPSAKDGCLGIRLEVKASQEENPTIHFILFALQGDLFRKVGKPKDMTIKVDKTARLLQSYTEAKGAHALPPPSSNIDSPLVFPETKKPLNLDYTASGDSSMEIEIDLKGGTTFQNQSGKFPSNLHQHLVSGKMILRNPTETDMKIRSVSTKVKEEGGGFADCVMTPDDYVRQSTFVGYYKGSYMRWGIPHPEVEWVEEGQEFTIPAGESVQMVVKAIWVVANAKKYNGMPLDMRLHARKADFVTVEATFAQDTGEKKIVCWDYTNEVLEDRSFTSYDDLVATKSAKDPNVPLWKDRRLQEVGDGYQCDLWLHVDDPETMVRYYIVVSSAISNPKQLVVRAGQGADQFPRNHNNVRPSDLKRLVFDAKRSGTSVVEKNDWSYDKSHCKLRVLVDLEREVAYAIEAEINLHDGKMVKKAAMYLELDRFVAEED